MSNHVRITEHTLLRYTLVSDYLERRAELRAEHLELVAAHRAGGLLTLAGALTDPGGEALLVFTTADRSVAEAFAARDPYVREGLVERYEIHGWAVVG